MNRTFYCTATGGADQLAQMINYPIALTSIADEVTRRRTVTVQTLRVLSAMVAR